MKYKIKMGKIGLHKNSLSSLLLKELESGSKMTLKEWAKKLGITYIHLSIILSYLRKKGFEYHPYKGKIIVKGINKKGILVNVAQREEWAVSAMNTYEDNCSLPFLRGQFRIFSAVLKEQPHLSQEITSFAENLMLEAINANKKLNSDRKLLVIKNK
jgi:hypothetical protein